MRRLFAGLVLLMLLLTACGQSVTLSEAISLVKPPPPPTAVEAVTGYDSFANALRAAGASVAPEGRVSLAFLHADGKLLRVGEERVQVYEYAAEPDALADAARFSSDGAWVSSDIGATLVNWFATPHLYHASRLIVVYVGDSTPTLDLLSGILGEPFAGGANPYHRDAMFAED
ncbi:MAG: hypothetical protein U0521_19115 [Anaerolineae bacterium]